jgi:hypothetical protein
MQLSKALTFSLGEIEGPVITRYRLGLIIHRLYLDKTHAGKRLSQLRKAHATGVEFNNQLSLLKETGILEPHPQVSDRAFLLLGRKADDAGEVACALDPFCYLSHLSAMSHYGLTNRIPGRLFLSSPPPRKWSEEADLRMRKDLGDDLETYLENGLPPLTRVRFDKLGRTEIHRFSSIHWGAYINVHGRSLRVSSIGRTFLDMLRNPELCGGMAHVIETYESHAAQYLRPIVEEIDRHGGAIDKVRAGYLMHEKMGMRHELIENWRSFVQRGGSRKLDPTGEYVPEWSDQWCISLNI